MSPMDRYADVIECEATPRPARGFVGPSASPSFFNDALPYARGYYEPPRHSFAKYGPCGVACPCGQDAKR